LLKFRSLFLEQLSATQGVVHIVVNLVQEGSNRTRSYSGADSLEFLIGLERVFPPFANLLEAFRTKVRKNRRASQEQRVMERIVVVAIEDVVAVEDHLEPFGVPIQDRMDLRKCRCVWKRRLRGRRGNLLQVVACRLLCRIIVEARTAL